MPAAHLTDTAQPPADKEYRQDRPFNDDDIDRQGKYIQTSVPLILQDLSKQRNFSVRQELAVEVYNHDGNSDHLYQAK